MRVLLPALPLLCPALPPFSLLPTLQGVELLPYHRLGVNKWEGLGLQYPLTGVDTPPLDKVMEVVQRLEDAGLNVICDAKRLVAQRAAHKGDL